MTILAELLAGAILLAGIGARIQASRYARRATDDTDELYHRIYVQVLRDCGHRLPARFPQFIGPGRNTYPAGYHWALSFFPEAASDAIGRNAGLIGDLLLGAWVSLLLASETNLPLPAGIALLGLYVASPSLMLVNLGPRSFHMTPRLPSQLLFGVIAMGVMTAHGHVSVGLGLAVTVLLALELLVSKFGLQVALFALPVLAIAGDPGVVLACFAGACGLATLVSRASFSGSCDDRQSIWSGLSSGTSDTRSETWHGHSCWARSDDATCTICGIQEMLRGRQVVTSVGLEALAPACAHSRLSGEVEDRVALGHEIGEIATSKVDGGELELLPVRRPPQVV